MKCCHSNKTMARKCKQNITAGFYKELCEREEIVEDLRLTGSEDNIYEVERLVEKKIKKVSTMNNNNRLHYVMIISYVIVSITCNRVVQCIWCCGRDMGRKKRLGYQLLTLLLWL